jgi:hypothetical protein
LEQEIATKKYWSEGGIHLLKLKPSNSPVWNGLLTVRDHYLKGRIIKIGNGLDTDFWRDPRCGPVSLKEKFQTRFDICNEQT